MYLVNMVIFQFAMLEITGLGTNVDTWASPVIVASWKVPKLNGSFDGKFVYDSFFFLQCHV